LLEGRDRLGYAALTSLVRLRAFHLKHVPRLVRVRQLVERRPGGRFGVQRRGEVLRYLDLARRGVQLDVYVQLIATRDSGLRAVVGAQADHELAAHGGDRAAVRVTVQRDGHRRALPSAKGLHDFRRNLDASGVPGSLHDDRPYPHGASVPTTPTEDALLERA